MTKKKKKNAEDFLDDASKEQIDELTGLVQELFDDWLKRHHLAPTFRMIVGGAR